MCTKSLKEILVITGIMVILGFIFTYPLINHMNETIPYSFHSKTIKQEKSGDHLQTYYWFWLL